MNTYAGFWLRFVAVLIDGIILGCVQFILVMPLFAILGLGIVENIDNMESGDPEVALAMIGPMMGAIVIYQIIFFGLSLLYNSFMEASNYQGSVGKILLGIKVTDTEGNKVTFGKAFVRNLCKVISQMILWVGYIMAGFTEKKQALHDIIASTLVVKKTP